jgi:pyrroline-5-carboxylate reductase
MRTLAVIGAGKMGEAIFSGLLRAGWTVDQLVACEPNAERRVELTDRHGLRFVRIAEAARFADVILVAVKPQDAGALLEQLAPQLSAGKLVVSICAGLPTAFFAARLPEGTPVVRVMPNTPALVEQGMAAVSAGEYATAEHLDRVEELFRPLGRTIRVPEYQQDAVTAISGSGPAYFFYVIEAMIEAGVLLGLPRQTAHELAVQTAVGSAAMLRDSGQHPSLLREAVTSPAGTTIAALRELDNHRVRAAFLTALESARDRARELARETV